MDSRKNHGRKKKKKINYLLYLFFQLMNKNKAKKISDKSCLDNLNFDALSLLPNANNPTLRSTITSYSFENPFPHVRNSSIILGAARKVRLEADLSYASNYNIPQDHQIPQHLLNTLNQRIKQTNFNEREIDPKKKIFYRKSFNFPQFPEVPIEYTPFFELAPSERAPRQDGMEEAFRKTSKIKFEERNGNKCSDKRKIHGEARVDNVEQGVMKIDSFLTVNSIERNNLNGQNVASEGCQHEDNLLGRAPNGQGCRWQSFPNGDDNWRGSTRTKTPRRSREILGLRRRRKELLNRCLLNSKYSSTSEEEFYPIPGYEILGDNTDGDLDLFSNKKPANKALCRRVLSLRERNLNSKIRKQFKISGTNDSDFGFRDYDTCVDSDDEGSVRNDDSDSSSRYGGGITSKLSLFSSAESDEELFGGSFHVWDSDEQSKEEKELHSNQNSSRIEGVFDLKEETPSFTEGRKYLSSFADGCNKYELVENIKKDSPPFQTNLEQNYEAEKPNSNESIHSNNYHCSHSRILTTDGHFKTKDNERDNNCLLYGKSSHEKTFNLPNKNIYQNRSSAFNDFPLHLNENNSTEMFRKLQLQKAFSTLKGEVLNLSSKLEKVSKERDLFENSLAAARISQIQNERETCSRLDGVTQLYEERLTELHSVIAELTRKLERQKDDIIVEEEEEEEEVEEVKGQRKKRAKQNGEEDKKSLSEYSSKDQNETTEYSTSDTADSEALYDVEESCDANNRRPQTDDSTSCEIDDRAVEAGECIADLDVSICKGTSSNSNLCNDNGTDDAVYQRSSSVGLEEAVALLKEEKTMLTQALLVAQHNISSQRSIILALTRESELLRNKLKEYQRMQPAIPISSPHISDAKTVRGLRQSPIFGGLGNSTPAAIQENVRIKSPSSQSSKCLHDESNQTAVQDDLQVICKLAERVRLKKAISGDQRITGSELSSFGVYTTGVAEQLVASLQEESDAQELFHALATGGGAFAPHERLKECELEAERLHSRIDHLKAQNDVLGATLSESKAHCDRLALMTGKAEAQTGALKMGVEVLDQIQEAYEILSALQEAQISFLIATCRMAGVQLETDRSISDSLEGIELDPLADLKRGQEQRRTSENVTRHLLSRLEKGKQKMQNGSTEQDGSNDSIDVSCERKVRNAIQALQEERIRILSCLKGGTDPSPTEEYFPPSFPLSMDEAHKLDLENAVLMQELTAIREERAELRAQVYLLEREKAGLELRTGTCEAQTAAYCITIEHLKEELEHFRTANSQESTGDSGVESSSCEADSLRREKQLKSRVEDLVATLETITKNAEARHRQSQEFINDLKKANSALLTAVDRLKKKYSLRVKRMEQQAINMVEKHCQQIKLLKHRIEVLEEQLGTHANLQQSATSETSF